MAPYTANGEAVRYVSPDEMAHLLHAKRSAAGGWMAKCPAHDDKRESLSIGLGNDGKTLLYCFAGCDTRRILDQIGLTFAHLVPTEQNSPPILTAIYDYTDADGVLVYQVLRFANPKRFSQRQPDGRGGWIDSIRGVERLPYNLTMVKQAILGGDFIFVVEGERDVQTLASLGLVGTTNSGGATHWDDALNKHFEGARIIILPDNDEPGQAHARQVTDKLTGIALSIDVLDIPGLPPKGDVTDWVINHGGTKNKLMAMVDRQFGAPKRLSLIEELRLYHANPCNIRGFTTGYRCIDESVGGWEGGELVAVLAFPNTGKSIFVAQMITHLAGRGAVIPTEMTKRQWQMRLIGMRTGYDYKKLRSGDFDMEKVEAAYNEIDNYPVAWLDQAHPTHDEVETFVNDRLDLDWVIVDSLNDIKSATAEGIFEQTNRTMDLLHSFTKRPKPLLVFATCHVNRASGSEVGVRNALGSSAVERLSSSILALSRPGHQYLAGNGGDPNADANLMYVSLIKSRFSEIGIRGKYRLMTLDGCFGIHELNATLDLTKSIEQAIIRS